MRVRRIVYLLMLTTLLGSLQGLFLGMEAWSGTEEGAISLAEARKIPSVLWVDARSVKAFTESHLAEAINLTEEDWTAGLDELIRMWEPDQPIVVYCDGGGCESSRSVSLRLRKELGVETVFWLEGGWEEILAEGLNP